MREGALARVSVYSMHDLVKGRALVRIEIGNALICHLLLLILIIIFLLHEKMIPQWHSTTHLRYWYRKKLVKRRALSFEKLLHQVETIITCWSLYFKSSQIWTWK
jgi:hypothetical protein